MQRWPRDGTGSVVILCDNQGHFAHAAFFCFVQGLRKKIPGGLIIFNPTPVSLSEQNYLCTLVAFPDIKQMPPLKHNLLRATRLRNGD